MTSRELETLALAVADGDAVDWSRARDAMADVATMDALRLIEAIAEGYRKDLESRDPGGP